MRKRNVKLMLSAVLIFAVCFSLCFGVLAYSYWPPETGGDTAAYTSLCWTSSIGDCSITVCGTSGGGSVAQTGGSTTSFATASGIRQYTATANTGYVFTRWVTALSPPTGEATPGSSFQGDKFTFSAVGDKTTSACFIWKNSSIQLNRPDWLLFGETGLMPLKYYLFAVFEPIITVSPDSHVSVTCTCDYSNISLNLENVNVRDQRGDFTVHFMNGSNPEFKIRCDTGYTVSSVTLGGVSVIPSVSGQIYSIGITDIEKPATLVITTVGTVRTAEVSPGSCEFDGADEGYAELTAQSFTVDSTGTAALSGLAVTLGGDDADSFALDTADTASALGAAGDDGDSTSFTLRPVTGLEAGDYTAEIYIDARNMTRVVVPVSFAVAEPPVAPAIAGDTAMTLSEGYAATSTGAYTVTGYPAPTVSMTSGDGLITWDADSRTLLIAPGLTEGEYPVTLTAANGVLPEAELTFTLTDTDIPLTGDDSTPALWASLAALAAAGLVSALTRRRGRQE